VGYHSLVDNTDPRPPHLNASYYDNCCSFSVTSDRDLLFDIVALKDPIPLIGLNGRASLTHSARFRCLPSDNGFDRGYYSADLQTTLFSLGYFQKCGGSYASTHTGIDIFRPRGRSIVSYFFPAIISRGVKGELRLFTELLRRSTTNL